MDKNIIDDAEKAFTDLKNFLNIKDEPKKVEQLLGEGIYAAIENFDANWFTAENLSELLQRMQRCNIRSQADDMLYILQLFKKHNENLYFNNVSKHILELTCSLSDTYSDKKFGQFEKLLSLIITNISLEKEYDLEWNDVLNKIEAKKCTDMTTLLNTWNSSESTNKKQVNIVDTLAHIKVDKYKISCSDMKGLLDKLSEEQKTSQFNDHKAIDRILNNLADINKAKDMSKLAQELTNYITEDDTTIILNKTSPDDVKDIYELVTQLKLTKDHLEAILNKLRLEYNHSSATDMVKLVNDKLEPIGFGKDHCQGVLKYLRDYQTADDVCALLDMFNKFKITLTDELIDNIINKSSSHLSADNVCKLLDKFDSLGVKPKENLNLVDNIINKLASDQTVDNVSELLKKLKDLNVPLNLNTNKELYEVPDNDKVYVIVQRLKSKQSAQNLSNLVEVLQLCKIQPVQKVCKHILLLPGENQNANDVANLLIALGNLVGFAKIQKDSFYYLPDLDSILTHIANGQSKADMLKLAKVLIAMGKNLTVADKLFRQKIGGVNYKTEENQDLEELLTLNSNKRKSEYAQKQREFVKEFTRGKEESEGKKEDKKSKGKLIAKLKTGNDADNIIANSEDGNINFNQYGYIIEKKINQTNGASNKKAVLKILGVALAILGILCIILSLTIASEVLLGLLIPGCVLSVAGIIFVLVGLFLNNKNNKPQIKSQLDYKMPNRIYENGYEQNNEINTPLLNTTEKNNLFDYTVDNN